nr:MAG TPA: hypothetical protein [Bacteriophage sp.]
MSSNSLNIAPSLSSAKALLTVSTKPSPDSLRLSLVPCFSLTSFKDR